jgi:hypothetical protein
VLVASGHVDCARTQRSVIRAAARGSLCLLLSGCMSLAPQLAPTEYAELEQVKPRTERDQAFKDNLIYRHEEPQGTRYTKGNESGTTKRSWQSLDTILRSDENSSAALPAKQLRRSRIFTALALTSSIVFIAGGAATAREGFSFSKPTAGNITLISGALLSVAFAVVAGVLYRRARGGYDQAVDVYNDSLGLRLGVMTPQGSYIPPAGVLVDEEGFVETEDKTEGPRPEAAPAEVVPMRPPQRVQRTAPSGAPDMPGPSRRVRDPAAPVGALTLLPQR